jgi:uncharacterized membrane protein (DUF485 family)
MKFRREREPVDPQVAAAQKQVRTRRRIILIVIAVIVVVIGYFVGAAFLPRWWARQIGGWTHDSFTRGLLFGLAFGIVFTLVPLAVAATAFHRRLNQRVRAGVVLLAIVFAIPNLLTLGISAGSGGGAHAGNRILDDRAPFFQGATLIGAIIAVIIFGLALWQARAQRTLRREKKLAKGRRRDAAAPSADV